MHRFVWLIATVGILAGGLRPVAASETDESAPQPTAAEKPAEPVDPAVDAVLEKMEKRTVDRLHARMQYELRYEIDAEEDKTVQRGDIWYAQGEPTAKFKVHFKEKLVRDRPRSMDEQHLFDGYWYVEKNPKTRTVTRRQVRAEGEKVDPFKLGEGPFPLPFGQQREDILAEFDVELAAPGPNAPPNTKHLVLTPHKEAESAKRFAQIHFWVRTAGALEGLPVQVRATKKAPTGRVDSHITVTFEQIDLNEEMPDGVFAVQTPDGYEEIIEPIQTLEARRNME